MEATEVFQLWVLFSFLLVPFVNLPKGRKSVIGLLAVILIVLWVPTAIRGWPFVPTIFLHWFVGTLTGLLWSSIIISRAAKRPMGHWAVALSKHPYIFPRHILIGLWEEVLWRGAILQTIVLFGHRLGLSAPVGAVTSTLATTVLFYFGHWRHIVHSTRRQTTEFLLFFGLVTSVVAAGSTVFLAAGLHGGRNIAISSSRAMEEGA